MSGLINPDDFVISRKRKKYKFAKFANAENCYELEEWHPRAIDYVELGAGTGLFSVEMASAHPDKAFIAIDVKADRLQKGAYEAISRGLTNISFIRARADQLDQVVLAGSVSQLWVTFPDPFPRERSQRRRLTHPLYLELYASRLQPSGKFYLKHDDPIFFAWSLEQLVSQRWFIDELSFDLHESELSNEYKIITTYEQRWLSEGRRTGFVRAGLR